MFLYTVDDDALPCDDGIMMLSMPTTTLPIVDALFVSMYYCDVVIVVDAIYCDEVGDCC